MPGPILRFNDTEVDVGRYELRRNGGFLRLERLPMELLVLLASRQGELVTREEVIDRLWGKGVYLDAEQGINTAIRKIRMCLHDTAENPKYIQTVVGKGYRFVPSVTIFEPPTAVSTQGAATTTSAPAMASTSVPSRKAFRSLPFSLRTLIAAVTMATIVVLAIIYMMAKSRATNTTAPNIKSLAVLPFENLSGDQDEEYLAEGITDALTTDLAQLHWLRVISRTSTIQYRTPQKSLNQIAIELNVDAIIEGTFSRSGNRIRITAQLIEAARDRHLWAEAYEGNIKDLLGVQSAIALNIARKISSRLSSEEQLRLAHSRKIDPEAQEAFLRGRYLLGLRGAENLRKAPFYFQVAVKKDPSFAEAYAGLAECYSTLEGWDLVREKEVHDKIAAAARKAVELDDNSSAAHLALAGDEWGQKNKDGVERELQRALELNPNNSTAHKLYGLYLHLMGQFDAAITEEAQARDLDPLSAHLSLSLGHVLYDARNFDEAIESWRKAMELDPSLRFLHLNIGWAYAHRGMHDSAIQEWLQYWQQPGRAYQILSAAYGTSGYQGYLETLLGQQFATAFTPLHFSYYQRAVIFAELGQTDHAFEALEKAITDQDPDLGELLVDADLEKLRSDQRFPKLVARCRAECGSSRPF